LPERVQKVLAGAGHGSRRKIEGWIREGRLAIDGRTANLGDTVRGDERITLDGRQLEVRAVPPSHRYIIYNKPEGEIASRAQTPRAATPCSKNCRNSKGLVGWQWGAWTSRPPA
jgi:16S rRNA U516 pseudouridylate synthase RsuA-like enzyme